MGLRPGGLGMCVHGPLRGAYEVCWIAEWRRVWSLEILGRFGARSVFPP